MSTRPLSIPPTATPDFSPPDPKLDLEREMTELLVKHSALAQQNAVRKGIQLCETELLRRALLTAKAPHGISAAELVATLDVLYREVEKFDQAGARAEPVPVPTPSPAEKRSMFGKFFLFAFSVVMLGLVMLFVLFPIYISEMTKRDLRQWRQEQEEREILQPDRPVPAPASAPASTPDEK
jgi:hypothetical protein